MTRKFHFHLFCLILSLGLSFNLSAIELRSAGKPIEGSYIIVLQSQINEHSRRDTSNVPSVAVDVRSAAIDLATAYDLEVDLVYEHAIKGFAVRASRASIASLRASRDVRIEYIEQDAQFDLDATQTNAPWGLDRIDQRDRPLNGLYVYDTTASNVYVYVIDSGIRRSHVDFGGRVLNGHTVIHDGWGSNDCFGHGTHVAGTVGGHSWGVAKGVRLVPVRVSDCTTGVSTSHLLAGYDWVAANGRRPGVVNISIGGPASSTIDSATNNIVNRGLTVVVSAGNSGANACNYSPARSSSAITVGNTTSSDSRNSGSNWGSCVDIFAPGTSIRSTYINSNTSTTLMTGTSMAAPHVAGAAALYLANNPSASPAQVRNAIVSNATTGRLSNIGSGSPNRLLYSRFGGGVSYSALKSRSSGKCVEVSGQSHNNNANVVQWDCWGGENQQFQWKSLGNGYHQLVARHSNKCLRASGGNVVQYDCHDSYWTQMFERISAGGGFYILRNRNTGTCLRVNNSSGSNGASIVLASCDTSWWSQQFSFD